MGQNMQEHNLGTISWRTGHHCHAARHTGRCWQNKAPLPYHDWIPDLLVEYCRWVASPRAIKSWIRTSRWGTLRAAWTAKIVGVCRTHEIWSYTAEIAYDGIVPKILVPSCNKNGCYQGSVFACLNKLSITW